MKRHAKKEGKKRSPFRMFLSLFLYVLIIGVIVVGLPKFLSWHLKTPFPMAAITSGSMWPVLKEGDLVFIRGVQNKEEIAIGDIIVYRNASNSTLTIHRVIEKNDDTVVTQGDANFTQDAPAKYQDVIGKTVAFRGKPLHIPYLGSITVYANNQRTERQK